MQEVLIQVHAVRHLSQAFWEKQQVLKRSLRAQATLAGQTRETAGSAWGRGPRSREAVWFKPGDALSWRVSERELRDIKAHGARIKVHLYAAHPTNPAMETSEAIGWFMCDLRDLAAASTVDRWTRLQGAGSAEVQVSAKLAVVAGVAADDSSAAAPAAAQNVPEGASSASAQRDADQEASPGGDASKDVNAETPNANSVARAATAAAADLDALPVGPGADSADSSVFLLTVSLKGARSLLPLGPQLDETCDCFWLSYAAFGVVVQTAQFPRLRRAAGTVDGAPIRPYFEPIADTFRLRATLPGLVAALADMPPLQIYLCAEKRIIAHASIDLGRVLPPSDWAHRAASDFSVAGMDGYFPFTSSGGAAALAASAAAVAAAGREPHADGVPSVHVAVELAREEEEPLEMELAAPDTSAAAAAAGAEEEGGALDQRRAAAFGDVSALEGEGGAADEAGSGWPVAPSPKVRTWAKAAPPPPPPPTVRMMAALERLVLLPCGAREVQASTKRPGGEGVPTRQDAVVRVVLAAPTPLGGRTSDAAAAAQDAGGALLLCDEMGGLEAGPNQLSAVPERHWRAKIAPQGEGAASAPRLAENEGQGAFARVLIAFSEEIGGDVLASADVPWPDPSRRESEAVVNLADAAGNHVGSCRLTYLREVENLRPSAAPQKTSLSPDAGVGGAAGAGAVAAASAAAATPRKYRLCINLASIKDMDAAAYLTVGYSYPHLGVSAPVRTAIAFVPPRTDTPLANSVCTYEFGATPSRLRALLEDHPLVASLYIREQHTDREAGVAALPLPELAAAAPRYFRCRETGRTFTSAAAFRAHWRALRRAEAAAGGVRAAAAAAAKAPSDPVEVRVVDRYVTVALADAAAFERVSSSSGSKRPLPQRLCSMRVVLMLEDMGLASSGTGAAAQEAAATSASAATGAATAALNAVSAADNAAGQQQVGSGGGGGNDGYEGEADEEEEDGAGEMLGPPGGEGGWGAANAAQVPAGAAASANNPAVAEAMRQWEEWRQNEESAWAARLRAKDEALTQRWERRESERRKSLQRAQTDYGKLEARLRKALADVEERERALKAKEEALRTEHASRLAELQLLQRRLREESRYQVELEKMRAAALEKQLAAHKASLVACESRLKASEDEFDRFRQAQRRTPEAALRLEAAKSAAAAAAAAATAEKERSEKHKAQLEREECRAQVHRLAAALKRQQRREASAARRELEQMRLEYLAREQRFALDGDRGELRSIRQELEDLRHVGLVQEAASALAKTTNAARDTATRVEEAEAVAAARAAAAAAAAAAAEQASVRRSFGVAVSSPDPADSGGSDIESGWRSRPPPAAAAAAPWSGPQRQRAAAPAAAGQHLQGQENIRPVNLPRNASFEEPTGAAFAAASEVEGRCEGDVGGEIQRLLEWRADLVATGVYDDEHPILQELDRRVESFRQ